MRYPFKEASLSKEYFYTSAMIIGVVILVFIWLAYSTYNSVLREREGIYVSESLRVATDLQESFKYLEKSLNFIANKISQTDYSNSKNIENILQKSTRFPRVTEDIFTWTMFDFVSTSGYVIVDSMRGVIENPLKIDNGKRSWFDLARSRPWKLHFSSPDIGLSSGEEIIPTGYGITDSLDNFIGFISIGFNIKKLNQKIINILNKQGTVFVILDHDLKEIAKTKFSLQKSNLFQNGKLNSIDFSKNYSGKISPAIIQDGIEYNFYRRIKYSPYIILIGDKQITIESKLYSALFPQLITLICITLFFLVILYFFRKKIVNPVVELSDAADQISRGHLNNLKLPIANSLEMRKLSFQFAKIIQYAKELQDNQNDLVKAKKSLQDALDTVEAIKKSKEEFMDNLAYAIKVPAKKVISHADYLIKNITLIAPENKMISEWKDIANTAKYMQSLVLDLLEFAKSDGDSIMLNESDVDIKTQLEYCINILGNYAAQHYIKIETDISESLPMVHGDLHRINQIFINIITNAIVSSKKNGIVTLCAFYNKQLVITVKHSKHDSLDKNLEEFDKDLFRADTIKQDKLRKFSISIAKKITELHDGIFEVVAMEGDKEVISVSFPSHKLLYKDNALDQ